ncbi:unnamed protein product [Lactuca virosa]|uniref:SWIM-type domain-containing protein n=1 Tax=Lactuca virosa TaxID=75947 RepID=A0AAU9LJY7_9ASTR|nr:unnamed protein product [Lactuca virosa]
MQCPFRVAAGWKYNERTFQIKFCNEMHLCARNYHFGSLVTSNRLAKHYLKDVIMKPKMTLLEMQADVLQRFSVSVSLGQCQRARATAMGMIEGKLEDHYAKVWDYAAVIRLSNPGTTCLVGVESNLGCNYFKRLWTVVPSGGDVFETRYGYNGYKVDLANHTCTCNLWMLSGIPCVHSQAAINYVHKDPSQFLSSWFHKDKYVATYSQNMQPVGGSNLWPMTEFIKQLPPQLEGCLEDPKTVRCGKCQQLGHNKISWTNDEVPKPPVPKRRIGRPRKDGGGQPIFDQFLSVDPAIPRSDAAPPLILECGDQVGGPDIPRSDVTPPPVSESGNQVGGPNVSPMKRTKMMARRGGKTKVSGSRNKTPKKTPNGKKHKSKAKEDVSLTCDEDFVDLFTHAPTGKQGMSQAKEDVQEQEHDDNEVKVSERLTLQELLMSGYTHADAVDAMKEVYGKVEEQQIEEKEAEEGVEEVKEKEAEEEEVEEREVKEQLIEEGEVDKGVEEREVEEDEIEGIQVEEEEVEGIVVEEERVEEREVGARVLSSRRSYGA